MSTASSLPYVGDLHEEQITHLLRTGEHAALLIHYFGELHYRELSELARLTATRARRNGARIALILPGVMGSRLALMQRGAAQLLWLHPHAVSGGGLQALRWPQARKVQPCGVMLPGYLKLKLWLQVEGFTPLFHAFDWRRNVDDSARALMKQIEALGKRCVIVGHSMGGLVARAAMRFDTRRRIERVVQMGAPNEGSFAPVQALRAVYPTVRKLACLDPQHDAETLAREVFQTLPGLYQLAPPELSAPSAWPADDLRPTAEQLAQVKRTRAKWPLGDARSCVIVGVRQPTIDHVRSTAQGFEYEVRSNGDGTVPQTRAGWPGARHWYVEDNHGALPQNRLVLAALVDLLREGETSRLTQTAPAIATDVLQRTNDDALRRTARHKVRWEALSNESRRRLLEPVYTPEFLHPPES